MNSRHLMAALLTTLLAAALSVPALADHALVGEKSDIRFISVKNAAVAEVHHFKSLSGGIEDGAVSVTIPLVDVETMIPIRNERMQKMLFETELYPKATLTGVNGYPLIIFERCTTFTSGLLSETGKMECIVAPRRRPE